METNHNTGLLLKELLEISVLFAARCDVDIKVFKSSYVMFAVSSENGVLSWTFDPEWDEYRVEKTIEEIRQKTGAR